MINTINLSNTTLMSNRKTGNIFLDFLKGVFLRKNANNCNNHKKSTNEHYQKKEFPTNVKNIETFGIPNKEKSSPVVSEEDISSFIVVDEFKNIDYIISKIDKKILEKVRELQEHAYAVDKTGIEIVECCVCLETDIKVHALECKHCLCNDCYDRLIEKNFYDCPYCKCVMRSITVEKFFAIITLMEYNDVGILYLPPIYVDESDSWKDYDLFLDIRNDDEQKKSLKKSVKRINSENYAVVYNNSKIPRLFGDLSIDKINKVKTISL